MKKIIKKAIGLLGPIDYEPEYVGYYLRVNGDDTCETFCEDCIGHQTKATRKYYKEERQKVLDKFDEIEKTGRYKGKKIKGKYTDEQIQRGKRYELRRYPARPRIETCSHDPDFSGGLSSPHSCDECGKYFYSYFEPDLEYTENMLECIDKEVDLSESLKWELNMAFDSFSRLNDDVKKELAKIAKIVIKILEK